MQLITQSSQLGGTPRLRLHVVLLDSVYFRPYVGVEGRSGGEEGRDGERGGKRWEERREGMGGKEGRGRRERIKNVSS